MKINELSIEQLTEIKGVGQKTAEKIVAARPISDMEELEAVIGAGTAAKVEGEIDFSVSKVREAEDGKVWEGRRIIQHPANHTLSHAPKRIAHITAFENAGVPIDWRQAETAEAEPMEKAFVDRLFKHGLIRRVPGGDVHTFEITGAGREWLAQAGL